jgi:hypothetical protein
MKSKNSLVSRKTRDNTRKRANRLFFGGEGEEYVTSDNIDKKFKVGTTFTREIIDCNWTDINQCNELCEVNSISKDEDGKYTLKYNILSIKQERSCTLEFDGKTAIGTTMVSGDKFRIKLVDAQSGSSIAQQRTDEQQYRNSKVLTSNSLPSSAQPGDSNGLPSNTSYGLPSSAQPGDFNDLRSNEPQSSGSSTGKECKLELFYDDNIAPDYLSSTGDYYNFFDKIKRGLFSEFKDILHEDGLIKGIRVGALDTSSRMEKFWYLFHVVLSQEQPVTCLQYACMWDRDDFVILILQYLIGASPEFAETYINYAADFDMNAKQASDLKIMQRSTKEHFTGYSNIKEYMTAYDLVGRCANQSYGMVSGLSQLGSIASNIPKAYYNVQYVPKVLGKSLKTVYNIGGNKTQIIRDLLSKYGGKPYNTNSAENNSVTVTVISLKEYKNKTAAFSQSGSSDALRYAATSVSSLPQSSNFIGNLLTSS